MFFSVRPKRSGNYKPGSCWFARNAVYIGSIGNHDFYRPHRSVFEWKQGMSKNCYADKMPASTPKIPRPRPPPTS